MSVPDMSRCAAMAGQAAAQIGEHPAVADTCLVVEQGSPTLRLRPGVYLYVYYRSFHLQGLDLEAVRVHISRHCGIDGRLYPVGARSDQFIGACLQWEAV